MIVTPIEQQDHWTCLARRGMLHSEAECVDFWRFEQGDGLDFGAPHGVDELILVLSGSIEISGQILRAGMVVFILEGTSTSLSACEDTTVLSARGVPDRFAALLPPRIPELPKHERAI